jgi:hypothetical protein
MFKLTFLYTAFVVPGSVIIPIVIALTRYRYLNKSLKSVLVYLLVAGIGNGVAAILANKRINNLPVLHVYTMFELVLLGLFFYYIMEGNWKRVALGMILLFPPLCVVNFLFIQDLHVFNSYTRPVAAILLILFSILYFYNRTSVDQEVPLLQQPETWMVTGMLIYFSSALVQFSLSNVVSNMASRDTRLLIWAIHASLVLLMYLLFAVGFTKCRV